MSSATTANEKGMRFERRVGFLFELHGYDVDRNREIAGRQFDLLISMKADLLKTKYLVECKDTRDPVGVADYDSFIGKLRSAGVKWAQASEACWSPVSISPKV